MKLRLEGDGTSRGTLVLDENNNAIENVEAVDLHIDAHGRTSAQITLVRIATKLDTSR